MVSFATIVQKLSVRDRGGQPSSRGRLCAVVRTGIFSPVYTSNRKANRRRDWGDGRKALDGIANGLSSEILCSRRITQRYKPGVAVA